MCKKWLPKPKIVNNALKLSISWPKMTIFYVFKCFSPNFTWLGRFCLVKFCAGWNIGCESDSSDCADAADCNPSLWLYAFCRWSIAALWWFWSVGRPKVPNWCSWAKKYKKIIILYTFKMAKTPKKTNFVLLLFVYILT